MKVSFKVYCNGRNGKKKEYYICHIFSTPKEMYEYNESTGYEGRDYMGLCRQYDKYKASKNGRPVGKKSDETGSVSLLVNHCGAGIVSHEFTHAGVYWFNKKYGIKKFCSSNYYDEIFAHIVSDLVNQFYNKWFKLEDNGTIKKIRKTTK
jgi:hypothetical protein